MTKYNDQILGEYYSALNEDGNLFYIGIVDNLKLKLIESRDNMINSYNKLLRELGIDNIGAKKDERNI